MELWDPMLVNLVIKTLREGHFTHLQELVQSPTASLRCLYSEYVDATPKDYQDEWSE
jgi:hypothetical protein